MAREATWRVRPGGRFCPRSDRQERKKPQHNEALSPAAAVGPRLAILAQGSNARDGKAIECEKPQEKPMLSVNTNTGAMVALQYLNKTETDLAATQEHINSGLKVANAKDDASTFAIAQNMRSDVAAYQSVSDSLNRGLSVADVAISAGQAISDLLTTLKAKALAAADTSLDDASRAALNADFVSMRDQIVNIVNNANFNGTNLVDGSVTGITALASADAANKISVASENMSLSGSIITMATTGNISTQANASAMITTINDSLHNVNSALARLASGEKKFTVQNDFVSKLMDTLNSGIGNLVDADMAKESSNLQALQVKQQLGVQALSIANSQPQILLSLFR
jgi:flagellin